jgi:hypothetical protein
VRLLFIVLLLALAVPAAAQDNPALRHRVVRTISLAQLEAICPDTYSCAFPRPPDTCLVYLPAQAPAGWPTRAAMLRHEFGIALVAGRTDFTRTDLVGRGVAPLSVKVARANHDATPEDEDCDRYSPKEELLTLGRNCHPITLSKKPRPWLDDRPIIGSASDLSIFPVRSRLPLRGGSWQIIVRHSP